MKRAILVGIGAVVLTGCGTVASAKTSRPPAHARMRGVITQRDYDRLDGHANAYKGARVDVVGTVQDDVARTARATIFQMRVDPRKPTLNTTVIALGQRLTAVRAGESVRVEGRVDGGEAATDKRGTAFYNITIDARSVRVRNAGRGAAQAKK